MSEIFRPVDSFPGNTEDPGAMAHRACPVCGADDPRFLLEYKGFQFFSDDSERAKRATIRHGACPRCHALYMSPCYAPEGFAVLFAEAGASYGQSATRPREQIDWLADRDLLRPGSTVLDVGCCEGGFVAQLPDDVASVGVDIDAEAIDRAAVRLGAPHRQFVCGDFESFAYEGPADTIVLFHVLEHLPRPLAVLEKLRSLAGAGTRLVVEVPILDHADTPDVCGFMTVQHVTHFSRRSLENTLRAAGWAPVEWVQQPDYNGCRVVAAPTEERRAPVGDPLDQRRLYDFLGLWYTGLARLNAVVSDWDAGCHLDQCVLWGGGMHTEYLYHNTVLFRAHPGRRYLIVDGDPHKQGHTWRGIPIENPRVLGSLDWEQSALIVSSYASQEAIARAAVDAGVPTNRVLRLYETVKRY